MAKSIKSFNLDSEVLELLSKDESIINKQKNQSQRVNELIRKGYLYEKTPKQALELENARLIA